MKLGWNTGAIVPELEKEIKTQNSGDFNYCVQWVQILNSMIDLYQDKARAEAETHEILGMWILERQQYM